MQKPRFSAQYPRRFLALLLPIALLTPGLRADEGASGFWSFRPVKNPPLPRVRDETWPRSPIDSFVLARLESEGLAPVEPAKKRTWLRRVTFDLTGLPPTPSDVAAFLDDASPHAYDKVVHRLLASPHYGERWTRYWLDVARYAEEQHIPNQNKYVPLNDAYKYRDWVLRALNSDLPYDQFILHQVAGDLLKELGRDGWDAVGFLALGPVYETDGGEEDDRLRVRYDTIDDKMDAVSRGFLGLTVACARCHDHKFDPVTIEDYYSLAGVFFNTSYVTHKWTDLPKLVKEYESAEERVKSAEYRLLQARDEGRSSEEIGRIKAELAKRKKELPEKPAFYAVHSLTDGGSEDIPVAIRGNPVRPGKVVPRQFLRVLANSAKSEATSKRFTSGSGRLELAQAIADPRNPLTARVMVNRIWQHLFGQGLVRTPGNFGALGEEPTHPELLDWLAHRFVEGGWSIKRLHREVALSATYRLSSRFNNRAFEIDGDNKLLWRMSPRRLDVEAWRDGLLAVSDEIDLRLGGPSVESVLTSPQRTLYAPVRRDPRFPNDKFLRLFDFPNPWLSNSQRTVTTVPPQQLFMMNSKFMIDRARALAKRLGNRDTENDEERITKAFALLFGRQPSKQEVDLGIDFLRSTVLDEEPTKLSRWEQYAQVLLSSNEFLYLR